MRKINCSTSLDILSNLGPDVELTLNPGQYDISDIILPYDRNVFFADTNIGPYGDRELILRGISNLSIIGDGSVEITNKYRYANVMTFIGCNNITLENLSFGHFPEMGGCRGGVLVFKNCKNITISGCTLFGCGTIGLAIVECNTVRVTNGKITKCNTQLLYVDDCEDCVFDNLEIVENDTRSIVILHSDKIEFIHCNFSRNEVSEWASLDAPLFYIGNSSGNVVLKSSSFDFPREYLVNTCDRIIVIE